MGRRPFDASELEAARIRRNALRREQYRLDGGKRKAENRAWKDAHREQVRIANRDYQRIMRSDPDYRALLAERARIRRKNLSIKARKRIKRAQKEWSKRHPRYFTDWNKQNNKKNPGVYLWRSARNRAKKFGLDFALEKTDIVVPEFCPVLNIPLSVGNKPFSSNSPSIDRIDNSKGYIKGNVVVVSWRANCIKRDASLAELRAIVAFMEKQ